MKKEQIVILICAIFITAAIMGVGISISLGSFLIFSLSISVATICCFTAIKVRKQQKHQ